MSTQDYFVKRLAGKHVQIKANGKTITKTGNDPQTCYTQKLIPSQTSGIIYKWYFKINRREHELVIGIASNHKTTDGAFHRNARDINYGYSVENGQKVSKNKYSDYGCTCNKNDKIQMILNLKKKQLSFIVNNINQGTIYNDIQQHKDIKYRIAIFLQTNGTSVTLQKYEEIKIKNELDEKEEKKTSIYSITNTNTNTNNKNKNNVAINKILKQLDQQKIAQQKMDKKLKNIMESIKDIKSILDNKQNNIAWTSSSRNTEITESNSKCSAFISNVKIGCYMLFLLMLIMFVGLYGYRQYFANKQDL